VNLSRQSVTTLLTLVMVAFWIITAVVRLFVDWPVAHVLDAAMAPIVGYWFVSAGKNGLLTA
jgi:hypothetical protein